MGHVEHLNELLASAHAYNRVKASVVIIRRSAAWLGSGLLFIGVASLLSVPSQFAREKDEKKFSKESNANLEHFHK